MRLMLERRRHQANRQAQAQHLDDVNKPRSKGGRADVAKGDGESKGKGKKGRGGKGDGGGKKGKKGGDKGGGGKQQQ
eukprot:1262412-Alexandrium_andersonii.AAC.1